MDNIGEYPELIRLAIAVRLYALTGLIWTVEIRTDNTNWDYVLGFDFVVKTGYYRGVSQDFDVYDLHPTVVEKWTDLVDHICSIFTHAWLYSLKMIPGVW